LKPFARRTREANNLPARFFVNYKKMKGGETMEIHERVRLKKITEQYGELKFAFTEFTKKLVGYKKGLEGFGCSISERKDLSISLLTPFDGTILISFSAPLLEGSKLWGKLTIEKLVEEKQKDNVKIWELYFDDLCNLYGNPKVAKSCYDWSGPKYLEQFFTILLTKFIDKCFKGTSKNSFLQDQVQHSEI
jgi:hypothetical protein